MQLTQDWIVWILSVLVSILLAFLPGLKDWWAAQSRDWRARTIIIVCFVFSVLAFVLACFGITVGSDAYCPDYTSVTALANAAYIIVVIAFTAAGLVQTLYTYGLKPIDNWLTTAATTKKLGQG
jgi:hypothetical protein